MPKRYSSEILVVITATESDNAPTLPLLRLALFGGMYQDTLNPSGLPIHYDGLIKSDIIFDKQIGLKFWEEDSGIDFGFIDIAVEDQDDDLIDYAKNVRVSSVELYRIDLDSPVADQLELLASAQCADTGFVKEHTIRFRLESILQEGFNAPINKLYFDETNPQLAGKPFQIAWGLIQDPMQLWPTILVDGTTLEYQVTDIEIDEYVGNVYDRGIALFESADFVGTTFGFTLNSNPDGRLTAGRILTIDPEDTSANMTGLFSFVRLAMTRAGLWEFANEIELDQLEYDIGMGELYPQYFTDRITPVNEFLDTIFSGVTGWYYVDELTKIHFGRLTDPDAESAPSFAFTDSNIVGKIKVNDDKAPGLSTRAAYAFSPGAYTEDELAGGVTGDDRTNTTTGQRIVETIEILVPLLWTADDDSWTADDIVHTADGYAGEEIVLVPSFYWRAGTSPPIDIPIGFCDDSDCSSAALAQAEIDRWWSTLYHIRRRFYTFDVSLNDPIFNVVLPQLGEFCTVQSNRFKLIKIPKNLFMRRLKFNYSKSLLTVEGWG